MLLITILLVCRENDNCFFLHFRMANYIFSYGERVYNIAGTSHCRPPDGSWKKYWLRKSGRQWPEKCRIWECKNSAYGGAHVLI